MRLLLCPYLSEVAFPKAKPVVGTGEGSPGIPIHNLKIYY